MNEVANKMYRIITRTCNGIFLAVFMLLPLKVSAQTITLSDASEWEKDGKTFARVEDHLEVVITGINNLKHLSVDGLVAKSEVFRLLGMGGCYICEFPKASAAHKLTEHQNQQMVPMRHRPALGPVAVLGEYSPELPLREELYYLCKNECPYMHICSDFESDTKVSISKPGQGIAGLKRYA